MRYEKSGLTVLAGQRARPASRTGQDPRPGPAAGVPAGAELADRGEPWLLTECRVGALVPTQAVRAAAASTGNQLIGFFGELMAYFGRVGEPGDPAVANALLRAWIAQRKGKTI